MTNDRSSYLARALEHNEILVNEQVCLATRIRSQGTPDSGRSSELWCYHELAAISGGSSSAVERQLEPISGRERSGAPATLGAERESAGQILNAVKDL